MVRSPWPFDVFDVVPLLRDRIGGTTLLTVRPVIYRGYHIVLRGGRYTVYESETVYKRDDGETVHSYVGRQGTFNDRHAAESWVRELIRAAHSQPQTETK